MEKMTGIKFLQTKLFQPVIAFNNKTLNKQPIPLKENSLPSAVNI